MNRALWLITTVVVVACGRDDGRDAGQRRIGPAPADTLAAALDDYHAKRISADSAARVIAGYQQRTGRVANVEMDAALLAAMQRLEQPR